MHSNFTNDGGLIHHGSPDQRECSAIWGSVVAAQAVDGEILAPTAFIELYDQTYPGIVGVNRSVCPLPNQCIGGQGENPDLDLGGDMGSSGGVWGMLLLSLPLLTMVVLL